MSILREKELEAQVDRKDKYILELEAKQGGAVTESIFSGSNTIIPLADVSHVNKHWYPSDKVKDNSTVKGYVVILKHTTYNVEIDDFNNSAYLTKAEGEKFLSAWCRYRYELEIETMVNT